MKDTFIGIDPGPRTGAIVAMHIERDGPGLEVQCYPMPQTYEEIGECFKALRPDDYTASFFAVMEHNDAPFRKIQGAAKEYSQASPLTSIKLACNEAVMHAFMLAHWTPDNPFAKQRIQWTLIRTKDWDSAIPYDLTPPKAPRKPKWPEPFGGYPKGMNARAERKAFRAGWETKMRENYPDFAEDYWKWDSLRQLYVDEKRGFYAKRKRRIWELGQKAMLCFTEIPKNARFQGMLVKKYGYADAFVMLLHAIHLVAERHNFSAEKHPNQQFQSAWRDYLAFLGE